MRAATAAVGFRLRTVRGHLDGVIRMVEEDRYCIDVLHQLSAVQGALERVRREVLEAHLRSCVPEAVAEGRIDNIVDELMTATFGSAPHPHGEAAHCLAAVETMAEGGT